MKVKIKKYRDRFILPRIHERWLMTRYKVNRFEVWTLDDKMDRLDDFVEQLEGVVYSVLNATVNPILSWWVGDNYQIKKIRIDPWDVWSMDSTLAQIIHPMLKEFRQRINSYPSDIDPSDVGDLSLHSSVIYAEKGEYETEEENMNFIRWKWIIEEMTWTFEQLTIEEGWESQFYKGNPDFTFQKEEDGTTSMIPGPFDTFEVDREAMLANEERIRNGLRLFGRYFLNLWS